MTDDARQPLASIARGVPVARLSRDGETIRLRATQEECASIAERLGVLDVESFEAEIVAASWRRNGASLRGRLRGVVNQESVVSLEAVRQEIDEPVSLTFLPESAVPAIKGDEAGEIELDPEAEDEPDVIVGGMIGVAAALEEVLALALDPYPRGAAEAFDDPAPEPVEDEAPRSPFAGLAALKDKGNDG